MLQIVRRIIQEVSYAETFFDALDIIVKRVRSSMATDVCSCYILDEEADEFVLQATQGLNPSAVGLRFNTNKGLVGWVGHKGEVLNLDEASQHANFLYLPETGEERYHSFLGVPIMHIGRLLGVLVVQQKEKRKFDEAEEAFLITISAQLASVIAHAQLTGSFYHALQAIKPEKDAVVLNGIASSTGVAIGIAIVAYPPADFEQIPNRKSRSVKKEKERFHEALQKARNEVGLLTERMSATLPPEELALFTAYQQILDSQTLIEEIESEIDSGLWAQAALRNVIKRHVSTFEDMEDPYLSERAVDVRDLGLRVLSHLQSKKRPVSDYPKNTILVGGEITAAQMAEVPQGQLSGIVSLKGSSNSHISILARAMDIPAVMSLDDIPLAKLIEDQQVIVDGYAGKVYVAPSKQVVGEYTQLLKEESELKTNLEQLKDLPAETTDGFTIPLYVNTGLGDEIGASLLGGAEGVGLYRTEMPFMLYDRFPSEEAQTKIYRTWLKGFAPRVVTMRTLDIGGDKMLPYFPVKETNPFLGWRGIRVSLDHPELFLIQIRALLKASKGLNNLQLLLPMISRLEEITVAKELISKAYEEVKELEKDIIKPKLGVMIEVPSAVFLAEEIAKEVDFISVGSNDLTQYLLAIDRNNPRVARLYDPLHPSVLASLDYIVTAAHKHKKPVSICGEMAGDPLTAILLIALGYDMLSMNASSLPRVKWVIRNFSLMKAKKLLEQVKQYHTAQEIREHLTEQLTQVGLGGLIRAGKH